MSNSEQADPPDDEQLKLIYDELRSIARRYMARERRDHTLQPTALVHVAWGRLGRGLNHISGVKLKACMAKAMRRVLVDHARAKRGPNRGGDTKRVPLTAIGDVGGQAMDVVDLIDLDVALKRLACTYPVHAQIVESRFFAGMTQAEIAEALGIGLSTVEERWRFARAWLKRELGGSIPRVDS